MAHNTGSSLTSIYVKGDLVQYVEYFYYPTAVRVTAHDDLRNNDVGIVVDTVYSMYGNELYDIYWLRTGKRSFTQAINLKLAYLIPGT